MIIICGGSFRGDLCTRIIKLSSRLSQSNRESKVVRFIAAFETIHFQHPKTPNRTTGTVGTDREFKSAGHNISPNFFLMLIRIRPIPQMKIISELMISWPKLSNRCGLIGAIDLCSYLLKVVERASSSVAPINETTRGTSAQRSKANNFSHCISNIWFPCLQFHHFAPCAFFS